VDADCAVITPIGLDHQEYLGPDLASIATEKAGVLRRGKPVVCAQASPPAPILDIARSLQAPVYRRGAEFELSDLPGSVGPGLEFTMGDASLRVPRPGMGGQHQLDNLAAALASVVLMQPECLLKADEMAAAIRTCRVPGRLQKVNSTPEILLDVGHNELAAAAIAAHIRNRNRPVTICVVAMLADKSAEAVALAMEGVFQHWLCAGSPGPRGQSGEQLARRIKSILPQARVSEFKSVEQAMQSALSLAGNDASILVFGSFTTVLAAAEWIKDSMQRNGLDAAKLTCSGPGS
jgi:dihydrofolate synthase/folylpolyglutamate synthase